ncbi:MAG: RidA family protein [Dethiobacteria bacterium]|jgi:2-iminobutanoate/2-iminopropanoate deaminase|nr:RidA family protein [Bacillota bacterium]NMD34112.1 RidA family protein [Bacillota bacterium]HOB28949.1 RidA family protein [Bacillota bacterium]HPZ41513.1 RidA family protein [Bacillota bacterium]HQD52465.1 RidA family protein [Bacillota bacterium]
MKLKTVSTENAPVAIGPYSQGIIHGKVLYISGQLPIDPQSGAIVSPDVAKQTEQCLENAKAIALQAGASLTDVIKTTVFVSDLSQFDTINKVYGQYFASHKPARACIEVARLPKDAKVEIEMIVALA